MSFNPQVLKLDEERDKCQKCGRRLGEYEFVCHGGCAHEVDDEMLNEYDGSTYYQTTTERKGFCRKCYYAFRKCAQCDELVCKSCCKDFREDKLCCDDCDAPFACEEIDECKNHECPKKKGKEYVCGLVIAKDG
ncbi:MAG: hypothetical protein ACTSUE_16660 [Promethearchaeota archaeon]